MPVVRKRGSVSLRTVKARLTRFNDAALYVGVDGEATYPNGAPVEKVAATHEFGYEHIPARPFIRPTVAEKRKEWLAKMRFGSRLVLDGVETVEGVLNSIGEQAVVDIQNTIKSIESPPLAPATVAKRAAKGQTDDLTKPLMETHLLINSITHEIKKK